MSDFCAQNVVGQIIAQLIFSGVSVCFNSAFDILKSVIGYIRKMYTKNMYIEYKIDTSDGNNNIKKIAILQEIKKQGLHIKGKTSFEISNSSPKEINFLVPFGKYVLDNKGTPVEIILEENAIYVYTHRFAIIESVKLLLKSFKASGFTTNTDSIPENLRLYILDIIRRNISSETCIITFLSQGGRWVGGNDIPRKFDESLFSLEVNNCIKDMEKFINNEKEYSERGVHYARGYLIHGLPGTGKTTIGKYIATKHKKAIYELIFNDKEMSDTVLQKLVGEIHPYSVVIIDEIDKQLSAAINNKNPYITKGGILSCIDGVKGLPRGTIVIATANSSDFLEPKEMEALTRPGRLEKIYNFTEKIVINI